MIIGNKRYEEIQIITDDNELIVSITDEDVVEKEGHRVVFERSGTERGDEDDRHET